MKIPRIQSFGINSAIKYTLKSGNKLLRNAKLELNEAKADSRKFLTGVMLVSCSLHPQLTGKNALNNAAIKVNLNDTDIFEHSLSNLSAKSSIGSAIKQKIQTTAHAIKKTKPATETVSTSKNILLTGKIDKTKEEINVLFNDLLLKNKTGQNPLHNKAGIFIEKGLKYDVNPVVLMSIAMAESARGTSKAAKLKNNVGGIMGRKGLRTFEDVDVCIDKMAETVAKHHNKSNINSLYELGHSGKYCNKSAARTWIKNVMFYVKKLS